VFSPHAALHMTAAKLAVNHTQLFFDKIREEIGDTQFNEFLSLSIDNTTFAKAASVTCKCSLIYIEHRVILSWLSLFYFFSF
jgi:hypothetical protein